MYRIRENPYILPHLLIPCLAMWLSSVVRCNVSHNQSAGWLLQHNTKALSSQPVILARSTQTPDLSSWERNKKQMRDDCAVRFNQAWKKAGTCWILPAHYLPFAPPLWHTSYFLLCVGVCIFRWVQTAEWAWGRGSTYTPLSHCTGIHL